MNKTIKTFSAVTILALAVSAQAETITNIDSQSVELKARSLPNLATEQQTVSISFAQQQQVWSNQKPMTYQQDSDEYWLQTSGAQLKQGLTIDSSEPDALIRFSGLSQPGLETGIQSRSATLRSPGRRAQPIDPEMIEIFRDSSGESLSRAKSNMISQPQLAKAGVFQNSSAFKMNSSSEEGPLTLRSSQQLEDSDQYLVNIKEKGSRKKLKVSAGRLAYLSGEVIRFKAELMNDGRRMKKARYKAYILDADGQRFKVRLKKTRKGDWKVRLPEHLPATAPGQLHELYISAKAPHKKGKVRRIGKLAFALAEPTAQLESISLLMVDDIAAEARLNVASEGRYEIRATLLGSDQEGNMLTVMRSHSAFWLEPGQQTVMVRYDQKLLEQSGLLPPYQLKDIELMDQGQLAVLHRQASL